MSLRMETWFSPGSKTHAQKTVRKYQLLLRPSGHLPVNFGCDQRKFRNLRCRYNLRSAPIEPIERPQIFSASARLVRVEPFERSRTSVDQERTAALPFVSGPRLVPIE